MPTFRVGTDLSPGYSTSHSGRINGQTKEAEDGPGLWAPNTHVGDFGEAPDSL